MMVVSGPSVYVVTVTTQARQLDSQTATSRFLLQLNSFSLYQGGCTCHTPHWTNQCCKEMNHQVSWSAGCTLADIAQSAISLLSCQGMLLPAVWPAVHQDPQKVFSRAAPQLPVLSWSFFQALVHPRCKYSHLVLLNFMRLPFTPFLQPVSVSDLPLGLLTADPVQLHSETWWGYWVVYKDIAQERSQDRSLRYCTGNGPPGRIWNINHFPLILTIQLVFTHPLAHSCRP